MANHFRATAKHAEQPTCMWRCRGGQMSQRTKREKAIRRNAEAPQATGLSKTPTAKAILSSKEGRNRKSLVQRRFIMRFAMDEMPRQTVVQSKNEGTSDGSKRHNVAQPSGRKSIGTQQVDVSCAQSKRRDSMITTVVTTSCEITTVPGGAVEHH